MDSPDFAEIMKLARAGDADGFRALYRWYHPGLLRYLRVRAPRDYEDLAADVWVNAVEALPKFNGTFDEFRKFLFTIAFRRAADARRKAGRRKTESTEDEKLETAGPGSTSAEVGSMERFATTEALELLKQLPDDQAEIIAMRVLVGFDTKSIAKLLNKREGAIRVAQHRGLARLAELLADEGASAAAKNSPDSGSNE